MSGHWDTAVEKMLTPRLTDFDLTATLADVACIAPPSAGLSFITVDYIVDVAGNIVRGLKRVLRPAAANKTIRARFTSRCAMLGAR